MTVSGWASPSATLGVIFTFTPLALICVALRLYTRRTHLGLDDVCVTAAMLFTANFAICVAVQVHFGLCRRSADLAKSQLLNLGKAFWVSIWNYYLGLGLAKLSIVLQCLRIFGHLRVFRIAAYTLGSVISIFTLWTFFGSVFLCKPISFFWDHEIKGGWCLPRLPLWFFNSSFNILTDILTALLPLPVINSLHLPRRQRRMLMAVLGLGGAICVVSLIRFYALYAVAVTKDPAWDNPQAALYANLEATTGIVASCLPTLKGLVARWFPRLFNASSCGRSGGGEIRAGSENLELGSTSKKSQGTVTVTTPTTSHHASADRENPASIPRTRSTFSLPLLSRANHPPVPKTKKNKSPPRMVIDSQMESTCEASPTEPHPHHHHHHQFRSFGFRGGGNLEEGLGMRREKREAGGDHAITVTTTVEQKEDFDAGRGRVSAEELDLVREPFERP